MRTLDGLDVFPYADGKQSDTGANFETPTDARTVAPMTQTVAPMMQADTDGSADDAGRHRRRPTPTVAPMTQADTDGAGRRRPTP